MSAVAAPGAAPGEDWKSQLALPPRDPRYKTEVRARRHPRPAWPTPAPWLPGRRCDCCLQVIGGSWGAWRPATPCRRRCAVRSRSRRCTAHPLPLRPTQDVTATKGNSFEDYFLKR